MSSNLKPELPLTSMFLKRVNGSIELEYQQNVEVEFSAPTLESDFYPNAFDCLPVCLSDGAKYFSDRKSFGGVDRSERNTR